MLMRGYTLLELVIVIMLVGILAAASVPLIITPITSYQSNQARLTLVTASDRINGFVSQQLNYSIPNSTLIQSNMLQWLHTDAIYQHATTAQRPRCDALQNVDDSFSILGSIADKQTLVIRPLNAQLTKQDWQAATNSGAVIFASNYTLSNDADCAELAAENVNNLVQISSGNFDFNPASNTLNRVYSTSGWRALACVDGQLQFSEISGPIDTLASFPATAHTLSANVANCEFSMLAGGSYAPPQLRLTITLSNNSEQQTLELLYELYNAS